MTRLDVPNTIWDAPSAPKAASVGTISGWNVGSTLSTEATNVLVGLTMPDPNAAWPGTHTMITGVDTDSDGKLGITGVPRSGGGYSQPPVSAVPFGVGPKADKIDPASRTAIALNGTMTSCDGQSGSVTVKFFDNHVVGCHVSGGEECTATQVDFLDTNRTKLTATGGTFTSKIVQIPPPAPTPAPCRGAKIGNFQSIEFGVNRPIVQLFAMDPGSMTPPRRKLTAGYRPLRLIAAHDIQAMYQLFSGFYENADAPTFLRDLSKKDGAILVRDKATKELRGFTTIKKVRLGTADGTPSASSAATPSSTRLLG